MMYHYLAESLFTSTESEIIFKYDIELMLKKQLFASDYFFNARAKIKKYVDK
jgi:hypothetical protein